MPARGHAAGGQRERVVAADAVDDQGGAAAAGGAPQLAYVQPRRRERDVGPAVRGQVERLVAAVHGDDARGAQGLQELDGHVAEPADADHDRARAGPQQAEGAADGVVGREPRVGQRRGGHRVEAAERDGQAW